MWVFSVVIDLVNKAQTNKRDFGTDPEILDIVRRLQGLQGLTDLVAQVDRSCHQSPSHPAVANLH